MGEIMLFICSKLAPAGLALTGLVFVLAVSAMPSHAKTESDHGRVEHGHELFESSACGGCHTLKDAGATGEVGPSLDGDPNLSEALIVSRVTNGQGAMPAFGDQLNEDEIADIAAYVMAATAK